MLKPQRARRRYREHRGKSIFHHRGTKAQRIFGVRWSLIKLLIYFCQNLLIYFCQILRVQSCFLHFHFMIQDSIFCGSIFKKITILRPAPGISFHHRGTENNWSRMIFNSFFVSSCLRGFSFVFTIVSKTYYLPQPAFLRALRLNQTKNCIFVTTEKSKKHGLSHLHPNNQAPARNDRER